MPKILTASITNRTGPVLDAHLRTVKWQTVESDYFYLTDGVVIDDPQVKTAEADPKPSQTYAVDEVTHRWDVPTFHWLATQRQRLLDYARSERYDYIWIVDSDLLFDKRTLASALSLNLPVVSNVFWTQWEPNTPPLPQVWLRHPYGLSNGRWSEQDFLLALDNRQVVKVLGLGAATLIRVDVLDKLGYWPLVQGLPGDGMWQGEDRHFSVKAARNHVPLWADGWPDIFHVYRPSDEAKIDKWFEELVDKSDKPALTDLVNFTIENCDESKLFGHVEPIRGVLGHLKLLPEITQAVASMRPGEERFVSAYFPVWYDLVDFRNKHKTLRVKLIDVK